MVMWWWLHLTRVGELLNLQGSKFLMGQVSTPKCQSKHFGERERSMGLSDYQYFHSKSP